MVRPIQDAGKVDIAEPGVRFPANVPVAELTRRDVILALAAVLNTEASRPGSRARFAGVRLTGVDLSGLNLSNVSFLGANLDGAKLAGCDLCGADFSEASMRGADLSGAYFEVWCEEQCKTYFTRADLEGAILRGIAGGGADFEEAKLAGADFTGAALQDVNLHWAKLNGAKFVRARLDGAEVWREDWDCAAVDADVDVSEMVIKSCSRKSADEAPSGPPAQLPVARVGMAVELFSDDGDEGVIVEVTERYAVIRTAKGDLIAQEWPDVTLKGATPLAPAAAAFVDQGEPPAAPLPVARVGMNVLAAGPDSENGVIVAVTERYAVVEFEDPNQHYRHNVTAVPLDDVALLGARAE